MATRKDIANRAGVSVSVVSRALNNSGYVNKEKKKEIIKIADELNYRPNPIAMSLQQQKTKQLLYYSKDLYNSFNIELYEGMIEEAEKNGYVMLINGRLNFDVIPHLMIDGIILPNQYVTMQYLDRIGKNYHLPVVTASYGDDIYFPAAVPFIESDLFKGTINALEYLREKGHRKIALVTPYNFIANNSRTYAWKYFMQYELEENIEKYFLGISKESLHNDQRVLCFEEEKSENDFDIPESFYEKGMLAADIFKERQLDATAVLLFNDEMAIGFSKHIKKLGYTIPEDLSIMGIDGLEIGQYMEPKLTSLEIQSRIMGAKCVQILISILEGKKEKCATYVPTRILERESVKNLLE